MIKPKKKANEQKKRINTKFRIVFLILINRLFNKTKIRIKIEQGKNVLF